MPISCASVLTDVLASRPELGGFRDHSDSERVEHQDMTPEAASSKIDAMGLRHSLAFVLD